jgi:hypothetical protein
MLKKFVGAAIVMVLIGGVALAETVRGLVTKIDESKKEITITPQKKGEKGEPQIIKYDDKTTVLKAATKKGDDPATAVLTDLTSALKKVTDDPDAKAKGIRATIEVTDGKATKITFGGGRGKRKKTDTE